MEPSNKKIRVSGEARRLIKEKAVRGNQSILSFLKLYTGQEPYLDYHCSEEGNNPPISPLLLVSILTSKIIYLLIEFKVGN